jgi:hypothetical protein
MKVWVVGAAMRFYGFHLALAAGLLHAHVAISEPYEDVHECDTYAAHPSDPNRWAKGVADEEIIPGPAVKYCRDAVAAHPDTPRFQFQLGRALWAANRLEEGTDVFLALEETFDYGPVYAYLGDAFFFGIGGVEPDAELSVQLYEVAAAEGFAPAQDALNALAGVADTAPVASTAPIPAPEAQAAQFIPIPLEQAAPQPEAQPVEIDFSTFTQPKALSALAKGDLRGVKSAGLGNAQLMGLTYSKLDLYLVGFNDQFSGTYNFKDPSCIQIYNPRVAKKLERDVLSRITGGGTIEGSAAASINMLLGTMQQLQSGNMMGMVDQQQQVDLIKEEGAKDAAKLILGYGCQNPSVQRIYLNVAAYVLGTSPVVSAEEKQRQAEESARKAEADRKRREQEAKQAEINRQAALRTDARKSCEAQFKQAAFCGCLVQELDNAGIGEADWKLLQGEFKAVIGLKDTYPTVPAVLKSCRVSASGN